VREFGCDVDARDEEGTTPLMSAADYARDAATRELLTLGADAAAERNDGTRAVHRAASSALAGNKPVNDPDAIAAASTTEALVDAENVEKNVDPQSQVGTPFLCACARGAEATARMLAARGADARAVTPASVGAATLAAASGALGALAAALDAGAPTDARPEGGMTALHVAASHPMTESVSLRAVDMLLRAGADPDAEDGEGLKAIHAAAVTGRTDVVERLVAVTAPSAGGAAGAWDVSGAQREAQAKMRAIRERHASGGAPDRTSASSDTDALVNQSNPWTVPKDEPAYVPVLTDARVDRDGAAARKREGDEAFVRGDDDGALEAYDASLALDDANAKTLANKAAALLRKSSTKKTERKGTSNLRPGGGLARGARRASARPRVRQGVVPRGVRVDRAGRLRERGAGVFRGDADRRGQRRAEAGVRRGDPPGTKREQARREVT
jgi:ankyrin repeat protein